ncbi:MAG: barstar family protein [Firmicutes bacterium]|nr:barstar family protein [Bacillota bacterium]
MKQIQISAAHWSTPRAAHEALKEALSFPDYYGHNLDALHDCLTELSDTQLVIEDCALAARNMPEKWAGFLAVFLDSAQENPGLGIKLLPGQGDYGE